MTFEVFDLLLKKYENIRNIWNLNEKELKSNSFLSEILLLELCNESYKSNLTKYLRYINKNDIKIIKCTDNNYPQKLNNIQNKPIVLYAKGNLKNINNESVAIVGSRMASIYGKKNAYYFSYELAKRNVNIVSGLAKGIDSYSHIGALKAKGKTIAVIGCGIDKIYPKENEKLYHEILKNDGLIISEYIVGTKPEKMNFPARNRIISGMSKGIIVVEAKERSGTLITVDFALEQGRDVYVIPGNIDSINSVGTNELIKQGAKLVTDINGVYRKVCVNFKLLMIIFKNFNN